MNNIKFDVVLGNGKKYIGKLVDYNQHWNIWLTGELDENYKLLESGVILDQNDYHQIIAGEDKLGFWHYGIKQLEDDVEHAAGYIWSSRPSVMNMYLSNHIVDAVINQMVVAISLEDLKRILKTASKVQRDLAIDVERWDEETCYHIVSLLNEGHDVHSILKEDEV